MSIESIESIDVFIISNSNKWKSMGNFAICAIKLKTESLWKIINCEPGNATDPNFGFQFSWNLKILPVHVICNLNGVKHKYNSIFYRKSILTVTHCVMSIKFRCHFYWKRFQFYWNRIKTNNICWIRFQIFSSSIWDSNIYLVL